MKHSRKRLKFKLNVLSARMYMQFPGTEINDVRVTMWVLGIKSCLLQE